MSNQFMMENQPINLIDNLNNIFFEQIFTKIDTLVDQVNMAIAYPQFMDTIVRIWSRRLENLAIGPNTQFLDELDIKSYVVFMHQMRLHFKEFHVHEDGFGSFSEFYDYVSHLCDIDITCFPNVISATLNGNPDTMVDEDIRDLTLILPNLKKLATNMYVTGRHIRCFRKLEELSFRSYYHSVPLVSCHVQDICLLNTNLRVLDITDNFDSKVRLHDINLPNLEVLKLNISSIEDMMPAVMLLPKLKKLCVRYDDSRQLTAENETIFQEVILAKSAKITSITVNQEVMQLRQDWYSNIEMHLPQLKKLVCDNWPHNELFLDKRYFDPSKLEVISFSRWEILREYQLLDFVRECPKLRTIFLNETFSLLPVLERFVSIRRQHEECKPLKVISDTNWHPGFGEEDRAMWSENPFVQMSWDQSDFAYREDGFEIDFE